MTSQQIITSVTVVVVIISIAGAIYFSTRSKSNSNSSSNTVKDSQINTNDTNLKSNVVIKDSTFTPVSVAIKNGGSVTWTNEDSATHDITFDSGLFSDSLEPGKSSSFQFTQPGTYEYHCDIHPSMTGKIIVWQEE